MILNIQILVSQFILQHVIEGIKLISFVINRIRVYQSTHQTFKAPKSISFIIKKYYHRRAQVTHSCKKL